jgi:hypothetical protein
LAGDLAASGSCDLRSPELSFELSSMVWTSGLRMIRTVVWLGIG